jgi:hypothetical protein
LVPSIFLYRFNGVSEERTASIFSVEDYAKQSREIQRRFGKIYCLHLQYRRFKSSRAEKVAGVSEERIASVFIAEDYARQAVI